MTPPQGRRDVDTGHYVWRAPPVSPCRPVCAIIRRPCKRAPSVGAWRSLVARIVRDDEVGGSNPLAPTKAPQCPGIVFSGVVSCAPPASRCGRDASDGHRGVSGRPPPACRRAQPCRAATTEPARRRPSDQRIASPTITGPRTSSRRKPAAVACALRRSYSWTDAVVLGRLRQLHLPQRAQVIEIPSARFGSTVPS